MKKLLLQLKDTINIKSAVRLFASFILKKDFKFPLDDIDLVIDHNKEYASATFQHQDLKEFKFTVKEPLTKDLTEHEALTLAVKKGFKTLIKGMIDDITPKKFSSDLKYKYSYKEGNWIKK